MFSQARNRGPSSSRPIQLGFSGFVTHRTSEEDGLRKIQRYPTRTASSQIHYLKVFRLIQSIFRPLKMHCKRRYKICVCLVILGELESFRYYNGFFIIFAEILDAI